MGLGCAEHFAGLDLLVFSFGERRSKPWHEAGAVVLLERSLKQAGGASSPGPPLLLCSLPEETLGAHGGEGTGPGGSH